MQAARERRTQQPARAAFRAGQGCQPGFHAEHVRPASSRRGQFVHAPQIAPLPAGGHGQRARVPAQQQRLAKVGILAAASHQARCHACRPELARAGPGGEDLRVVHRLQLHRLLGIGGEHAHLLRGVGEKHCQSAHLRAHHGWIGRFGRPAVPSPAGGWSHGERPVPIQQRPDAPRRGQPRHAILRGGMAPDVHGAALIVSRPEPRANGRAACAWRHRDGLPLRAAQHGLGQRQKQGVNWG